MKDGPWPQQARAVRPCNAAGRCDAKMSCKEVSWHESFDWNERVHCGGRKYMVLGDGRVVGDMSVIGTDIEPWAAAVCQTHLNPVVWLKLHEVEDLKRSLWSPLRCARCTQATALQRLSLHGHAKESKIGWRAQGPRLRRLQKSPQITQLQTDMASLWHTHSCEDAWRATLRSCKASAAVHLNTTKS